MTIVWLLKLTAMEGRGADKNISVRRGRKMKAMKAVESIKRSFAFIALVLWKGVSEDSERSGGKRG